MAQAPFQRSANIFGQFATLGQTIGRGVADVGMSIDQYRNFLQSENAVQDTYDALNKEFGLNLKSRPGETPKEAISRAAGLKLLRKKIEEYKGTDSDLMLPSMKDYAEIITDFEKAKSLVSDMDNKFTKHFERQAQAQRKEQEVALGREQIGMIQPGQTREQAAIPIGAEFGEFAPATRTALGTLPTRAELERTRLREREVRRRERQARRGAGQEELKVVDRHNRAIRLQVSLEGQQEELELILSDLDPVADKEEYKSTKERLRGVDTKIKDQQRILDGLSKKLEEFKLIPSRQPRLGPAKPTGKKEGF